MPTKQGGLIDPNNAPISGDNSNPVSSIDFPFVDESIESVTKSTINYLRHHLFFVIICIIITVLLYFLIFFLGVKDWWVYLVPLLLPGVGYTLVQILIQNEFMQQFAADNDFSYSPTGTLDGLNGQLFQIGRDKSVTNVISGQYQNHYISLFNYSFTRYHGQFSQGFNYTIFKLQFDTRMPDLLLETTKNNLSEYLFEKLSGKNLIKMQLEGDFGKYFTLWIQKGYEIETLEIFTPDIMMELLEKLKSLSPDPVSKFATGKINSLGLEIVNDQLFIYDDRIVNTKKDLYTLYELARYFIEKLGPVLSRMKPSLEAMKQYQ